MGMGEDQVIDPADAFPPQHRRNDPFADVERTAHQAAPVDEHDPPARELDEDGFALADVDQGDHEVGRRRAGRRRREEDGEEREPGQHGRALAPEPRPEEREPEEDKISGQDPRPRRRDPEGQEREGVERVRDPGEEADEEAEENRRRPGRGREGRRERQEDVADGHDRADERDGGEVQDERRQRDAVEAPGDDGGRAQGGRDRQTDELRRLERQARQPLQQGRREEDDGQGGGVGQLEADVEEARRIGEEQDEGARRDGVQDVDVLPKELPGEEGQGHEGGPEDGRAALDEDRVEDEEYGQGQARGAPGQAHKAEEREEQDVDDGDVAAGNGEKVVEPRLLEVGDRRLVHPPVLAEQQGFENGPGRGDVETVGGREAAFEEGLDAAPDPRDPGPRGAARRGARPGDEERGFRRGPAMDVQPLEIPLVGKSAEVAEGAARAEADRGPDRVAGQKVQPAARPPREGHAQAEPAAERGSPLRRPRRSGPRRRGRRGRLRGRGSGTACRRCRRSLPKRRCEGGWSGDLGRGLPGARPPKRRRRR